MVLGSFVFSGVLVTAAAFAGSQVPGMEKRSHFGLRVLVSCLTAPALLLVLIGGVELNVLPDGAVVVLVLSLIFLCVPALMLLPSVLFRSSDSSPGDADDGGGSDPGQPPSPPDPSSGPLPLPDADPGRWRVRDHDRPDLRDAPPRRPAREPERTLAPTSLGDQCRPRL